MQTAIQEFLHSRLDWLGLVIFSVAVGVGLLSLLAGQTPYGMILLVGLVIAAGALLVLFERPGWILVYILFYVWLIAGRADPGELLAGYSIVRWGTYLLIPIFAGLMLVRIVRRGYWRRGLIELFVIALVALMAVSGMVNATGWVAIAFSIAIYLRYPLLFLILINLDIRNSDYKRALRWLIYIATLLIIEAILSYILLGRYGDITFLTTGSYGTTTAGFMLSYAACFAIAHALLTKVRWYHFLVVGGVLLVAWIAIIRSLFIIIPLLFLVLFAARYKLIGLARARVLAVVLLGLVLAAVYVPWDDLPFALPINPGDRLVAVQEVLSVLTDTPAHLLLGFGPRSFSPGNVGEIGSMYLLLTELHSEWWVKNMGLSEFVNAFSELGLLGFALYWWMLFVVLRQNLRFWRFCQRSMLNDKLVPEIKIWSIVSLAFIGIWFHYAVFGVIYWDVWRTDISSLVFWGCAAALISEARRRQVFSGSAVTVMS